MLFGILDLIAVATSAPSVISKLQNVSYLNWILISFYVTLIFSGILLIRSKVLGIWINYFQFPIRLIFNAGLSVGFLYILSKLISNTINYWAIFMVCAILETVRLILTIIIQNKIFKKSLQVSNPA
jgi:hypothetical protein